MKHAPKYLKETPEDKHFRHILISMIGSIFLCVFCLVGSTWAWFETTITSTDNVITIGEMTVAVSLSKGGTDSEHNLTPSSQYTYKLEDIGTYKITLSNNGNISGYCTLRLTDATGATEEFTTGTLQPLVDGTGHVSTITIEITAMDNYNGILPVELYIKPHWGDDPVSETQDLDEELFLPPTDPTDPTEETSETEPTDPAASTPTDPAASTPTDPTDATEPTQPSEPAETTPATDPTEPDETTAATDPTEPDETTAATDPTEPEETTAATEPTQSGASAVSDVSPTQPTDPMYSQSRTMLPEAEEPTAETNP